ncbi:MAG TPA: hypothetical protein VM658_22205 [bacterium]|nr:hypothetical protein [bacterium]
MREKAWMGRMGALAAAALVAGMLAVGCGRSDEETVYVLRVAGAVSHLVSANTDYMTGGATLVRMDAGQGFPVWDNTAALDSDIGAVETFTVRGVELAFVVGRMTDSIYVLNPGAGLTLSRTLPVGPGFWAENPQDVLVVSDDKAYVTRHGSDDILIINPLTGDSLGHITFAGIPTNADGLARPADMVMAGDTVFVALQNLDIDYNWGKASVENGILAVIDPVTDTVGDTVMLSTANPQRLLYDRELGMVVVINAGLYFDDTGQPQKDRSGIELVSTRPPYAHSVAVMGDDPEVDGNIYDGALWQGYTAYVLVTEGWANVDRAIKVNLVSGAVDAGFRYPAFGTGDDDLSGIVTTGDGWLAVGDRRASGIFIMDLTSDAPAALAQTALPPMYLGVVGP